MVRKNRKRRRVAAANADDNRRSVYRQATTTYDCRHANVSVETLLLESDDVEDRTKSRPHRLEIPSPFQLCSGDDGQSCGEGRNRNNEDRNNSSGNGNCSSLNSTERRLQSAWQRLCRYDHWKSLQSPSSVQCHVWPILLGSDKDQQNLTGENNNRNNRDHKQRRRRPALQWNLISIAPTGSGKTLAYGIPLLLRSLPDLSPPVLSKTTRDNSAMNENNQAITVRSCPPNCSNSCCSLVLLPTRELVQQVGREIQRAARALFPPRDNTAVIINATESTIAVSHPEAENTSSTSRKTCAVLTLHGGVSREEQLTNLQTALGILPPSSSAPNNNNQSCRPFLVILVATSGRLLDLLGDGLQGEGCQQGVGGEGQPPRHDPATRELQQLVRSSIDTVVLDEADQLAANRDLTTQVDSILLTYLQPPYYIWLFSATWPGKVTAKWREWISHSSSSSSSSSTGTSVSRHCAVVKVNSVALIGTDTNLRAASQPATSQSVAIDGEKQTDEYNNSGDENEAGAPNEKKRMKHQWSDIPSNITQTLHVCAEHKKPRKLIGCLEQVQRSGTKDKKQQRQVLLGIVFFAKIKTIQHMYKLLQKERIPCVELHSRMSQSCRERNVLNFKSGKFPLLLATDIAARGLHVSGIRFVINYDFPGNLEHYVYRCGRAGRDGKAAAVFSFFTRNLAPLANDMIHLLKSSQQWLDPNLVSLAQEDNSRSQKKKSWNKAVGDNVAKKPSPYRDDVELHAKTKTDPRKASNDDDDEDDEDYPSLALDRIVLRRASHISDASDENESSSSSEDA